MAGRPQRRRAWWTLPALLALVSLPAAWGMAAAAALVGLGIGIPVARRAIVSRRDGAVADASSAAGAVRLGADRRGREITLSAAQLGSHGLIVGATGAGKSTTLLRVLTAQIEQGRPVVAIDLKGSPAFAATLRDAAARAGRPFALWTPDGDCTWNPLAHGNATELKDKLIATERFTEPHYQRAAERYVQTALQVLERSGRPATLATVVELMEPRRLAAAARRLGGERGERWQEYLTGLTPDQLSAVRGLGTRLALLSESSAGAFLQPGGAPLDLHRAMLQGAAVVFSLNSARYGHLAAQLGTLAVQDLISVSGRRLEDERRPPVTVAIDEFSALPSDQLLALLARGRESGMHVLVATQELADLERAGRGFRDQVLGLTAVKIIHRQDVPASARLISELAGTEWVWERTRDDRGLLAPAGARHGTRREVERPALHPNEVLALPTGQAVIVTKTPRLQILRVSVHAPPSAAPDRGGPFGHGGPPPTPTAPPAPTPAAASPPAAVSGPAPTRDGSRAAPPHGRRGGRDQPEPGVTR